MAQTNRTLLSAGTERMLVDFGKANLLNKARQQPDKVREVLDKARTDGTGATLDAVQSKLDQPLALGYCNVGAIAALGSGIEGFSVGDRVVSNGKHAEVVAVPKNLCARIPDNVSDDAAAFTVVAAIGLQGIRLAEPTLGECVVVTGLGLIGLLTVQMLRAQGCRVMGVDVDTSKLELARQMGAEVTANPAEGEDVLAVAERFSRDRGVDAVLITAATKSNEPVSQAAKMCRKRGRIVLVGVTGLELSRADFYEKELSFQVSCSYGPGRYDPAYEEGGQDYPVGFVRWTEQRNFEAVLDLMSNGALDVSPLITHRFPLEQAAEAYDLLSSGEPSLGILLEYSGVDTESLDEQRTVSLADEGSSQRGVGQTQSVGQSVPRLSFIGAGNYATRTLLPAFKAAGAQFHSIASSGGVSGLHAGRKFGFANTTTDTEALIDDPATEAVVITTRHDSHARWVIKALEAGKPVFVEKPLCLTQDELVAVSEARQATAAASDGAAPVVMVGFNRRFSPLVVKLRDKLKAVTGPKAFVMTVNAGGIPADHWTQDPVVGGGRLIGEACHFIDLLRRLAGAEITEIGRQTLSARTDDTFTLQLGFADGSIGTVHYFANGSKRFPKERLDVFAGGRILQLDNFRRLRGYGWPGFTGQRLWRQDKGQQACAAAFLEAVRTGGPAPIPWPEIEEVARVTLELANQ
ncbi:bi-domain-containing oxidoreductase [Spiribacter salinus]|uniref:bi-domain-containing oxidoreductase n=1 Tax=Spiribacter salinus TaxID=1335746 RepID=UPI0028F412BA|nr:bi-domain-containing oxidoreductase [Spiribacter salinus]